MSILIPGMSLPKDGEMLVLCVGYNGKVLHPIEFATEDFLFAETGKTAIELPPHGRLGDLDALIDVIEQIDWYHQAPNKEMVHGANSEEHQAWYKEQDIYEAIENAPTIIPAEGGGQ